MFTDDLAYKQLSESSKNYSLQKYIRDTKMGKHQADSAETILSKNYIGMILAKIMDHLENPDRIFYSRYWHAILHLKHTIS